MEKGSELYVLLKEWRSKQRLQKFKTGKYWQPLEGMENIVFTSNHGTPHFDMNVRTDQRKIVADMKEAGIKIDTCTFHITSLFCYQVHREWHGPESFTSNSRTQHVCNDNGSLL